MSMQTVYFVNVWMLDENGDPGGYRGHSLRPNLDQALEAAREIMSKRIAQVSDGKMLKCEIIVYEHEDIRQANLRIMKMMLSLGFPIFDPD